MGESVKYFSFAGGEVTPELHGRTDLDRLRVSLRTCKNFILTPTGAAKNRPGTRFIAECKDTGDDDHVIRLIPFVFNSSQSYILEVGELYIRFFTNGGAVLEATPSVSGTADTATSATVLTDSGESWTTNEYVGGTIKNTTDGSQGIIISNTATTATVVALSGGTDNTFTIGDSYTIEMPYEVATPYAAEDVFKLKFTQLNDIMTITHRDRSFPPYELRRTEADNSWSFDAWSVTKPVEPPSTPTLTSAPGAGTPAATDGNPAPTRNYAYVVTSVDQDGNESLPSGELKLTGQHVGPGYDPAIIAWSDPAMGNVPTEYVVYRGQGEVYGLLGVVKNVSGTDQFEDDGSTVPDASNNPPNETNPLERTEPLSTGTWRLVNLDGSHEATKTYAAEAFDDRYAMYWKTNGSIGDEFSVDFDYDIGAGWITQKTVTYVMTLVQMSFVEDLLKDGMNSAAHKFRLVFTNTSGSPTHTSYNVTWQEAASGDTLQSYPAVVGYHEQRLVFGSFEQNVASIKGSRVGQFHNFDVSFNLREDDAYNFTIASKRLDEIRWIVSRKNALLIGTGGRIYVAGGGSGLPLSPVSVDIAPVVHYPAGWLDPLEVGNSIIYYSERGRVVREFVFDPTGGIPSEPRELTILARHLMRTYDIIDWAYADEPSEICWCVRDDGVMLGLTYLREHNVWGWHRHQTGYRDESGTVTLQTGDDAEFFESVETIPEGRESATYVITRRRFGSTTKRFVERLEERETADDPEVTVLLDCALSSDNRKNRVAPDEALTSPKVRLTGGSTWAAGESMTFQADSGTPFTSADVGKQVEIVEDREPTPEDQTPSRTVRADVTAYVSPTQLTVEPVTAVPEQLRDDAGPGGDGYMRRWGRAFNSFAGLSHLEGETVSLTVDGGTHAAKTVTNGVVTLDANVFGQVVHVGLPYVCDLESLPIWFGSRAALRKRTPVMVGAEVDAWSGLQAGQQLASLVETKQRMVSEGYGTVNPSAGLAVVRVRNKASDRHVAVALRQSAPVPVTILSLAVLLDMSDE